MEIMKKLGGAGRMWSGYDAASVFPTINLISLKEVPLIKDV